MNLAHISDAKRGNVWKTKLMSLQYIVRKRTLETYAEEKINLGGVTNLVSKAIYEPIV